MEYNKLMKEYQRKKNNKYILPQAVYLVTIWTIRDYQRMKDEYSAIGSVSSPVIDGMPHGQGGTSDPTLSQASKAASLAEKIEAIETARNNIPREYRRGVWESIQYRSPYPMDADRSTYGRAKSRFVYEVAEALYLI